VKGDRKASEIAEWESRRAGIGTSYKAWILRERSVSGLEFEDLTYSNAPPLTIPEHPREICMDH
jgi:hypothetical protein